MRPFLVLVSDLMHRPGARRRVSVEGPVEQMRVGTSAVPAGSVLGVDALLEWVQDGILVSGKVSSSWIGECRRCLRPLDGTTKTQVRELFELHPTDKDSYTIRHDHLDLEPLAREAAALDLPIAPLCRDDCAGLCPECGQDLNDAACGCPAPDRDLRWAALDALRIEPSATVILKE